MTLAQHLAISPFTVRTEIDSEDETISYVGEAAPGSAENAPAWRIKRIEDDGEGTATILFADGNSLFDNVWENREDLDYS